jgi:V/A-type H+-transporting ATPase subunit F
MKIAILADGDTVNCFKLAGFEHAYSVKDAEEAKERIRELLEKPDFAVVIITDHIANRIRATINEVTEEREFPLIISIPSVSGPSPLAVDPINELIKRKTGIELKL